MSDDKVVVECDCGYEQTVSINLNRKNQFVCKSCGTTIVLELDELRAVVEQAEREFIREISRAFE